MRTQRRLKEIDVKDYESAFAEILLDFLPIKTRSLFPESLLPCDIYFPVLEGPARTLKMDKLLASGQEYQQDFHDMLLNEAIDEIYIRREKEDEFIRYFSENVQRALQSANVPTDRKTQLLYDNAELVVKRIFKERPTRSNVHLGRQLVSNIAAHLTTDKVSVEALFSLFSKDYYTYTHCVQVAFLGMSFCEFLGWRRMEVAEFGLAALLHDIGKNSIDSNILNKPSQLTKDEFEEIKRHSTLGYQQLKNAQVISREQLSVVLHHHEAMDGSGYPYRLRGEEIHKYARVARIVDCYDALTTKRCYKDALPAPKALGIMQHEMGSTFDAHFLEAFTEFLKLREEAQSASPGSPFAIDLGNQIVIQLNELRVRGILVGMEPKGFLILRIPSLLQHQKLVQDAKQVIARFAQAGVVYGFRAPILGHTVHPLKLLFLGYPDTVERVNLRKHERLGCLLRAKVRVQGLELSAIVVDISRGGCRLAIRRAENPELPGELSGDDVGIDMELPGSEGTGFFSGRVRRISADQGTWVLGIQFTDLDEGCMKKLQTCIDHLDVLQRSCSSKGPLH